MSADLKSTLLVLLVLLVLPVVRPEERNRKWRRRQGDVRLWRMSQSPPRPTWAA
jgi:hypothetical protein